MSNTLVVTVGNGHFEMSCSLSGNRYISVSLYRHISVSSGSVTLTYSGALLCANMSTFS